MADTEFVDYVLAVNVPATPSGDGADTVLKLVEFAVEESAAFTAALHGWEVHALAVEVLITAQQPGYFRIDAHRRIVTFLPPVVGRAVALIDTGGDVLQFIMRGAASPFDVPRSSQWLEVLRRAVRDSQEVALFWHPGEDRVVHARSVKAMAAGDPVSPAMTDHQLLASLVPANDEDIDTIIANLRTESCSFPTCSPNCLPMLFVMNYCWTKAELVCRRLAAAGITALKLWAYPPQKGEYLVAQTPNSESCDTRWNYHVAVLVASNGSLRVIEPTLFPCASVSFQDWQNAIVGLHAVSMTSVDVYDQYPLGETSPEDGRFDVEMIDMRSELQTLMDTKGGPPFAKCRSTDC